jgi:hypothetical protein
MHSNEFEVGTSPDVPGDLLADTTTGYVYEVSADEAHDFTESGRLPSHVIDLATQHRGQHTIDLAKAEVEAGFAAIDARREQRATDKKVARWASGENVR